MVRAPALGVPRLHGAQDVAKPLLEIGERAHGVRAFEHRVAELDVHHTLANEIDERIGLGVDVVLVEQDLRVLEHLAQPPRQRVHVVRQCLVRPERGQRVAARGVRGKVFDVLEGLGRHADRVVQRAVGVVEARGRLVEEAEVGPLHVEADGRHASLLPREMGKDRREQPLDRTGLGGEPRHARDVEVRRLGAEQEVGVEIHGALHEARPVDSDGDAGVLPFLQVAVHAQCHRHIGFGGEVHDAHGYRLQRLVGDVAQRVRRVQPDFRSISRRAHRTRRVAVGADDIVQRGLQVGVRESLDDHPVDAHHLAVAGGWPLDAHDRPDAHRRAEGGPKVELVGRVGAPLGGDDSAYRHSEPEFG